MNISELYAGQVLTNQEISETFLCSTQGGMRRSKRTNTLVLISNQMKVYHDSWKGEIFHYTGMGLIGDQDFFYMQNRTLYESKENGVEIHLFEVYRDKEYTYRGKVVLAETPYVSEQPDADGHIRKVCMFPLRLQ